MYPKKDHFSFISIETTTISTVLAGEIITRLLKMLHKLNAIVTQGYCSKWAMKTSLAKRYMYWKSKVLQDEPSLQSRRILQRDP